MRATPGEIREQLRHRLGPACLEVEREWSILPPPKPAAVLVGLVAHPEGPNILLTQRADHLENHAGEISLPGGRVEAQDAGPAQAALRETSEEIGLAPDKVELLGCLPLHVTVTGFHVYPFVGWITPPVELTPDEHEVREIFEVPLAFVLDQANHQRHSLDVGSRRFSFYVLQYAGHRIWGATAEILVSLAQAANT